MAESLRRAARRRAVQLGGTVLLLGGAALLLGAAGCGRARPSAPAASLGPPASAAGPGPSAPAAAPVAHNVIFILVDTLRADHLPLYGYRRDTSPNLTVLGRESLLFLDARSQASCTFPSVNSMLTSRSGACFLGQPGGALGLPAGIPGLAELLRVRGMHTAAVSASPIVRRSPSRFNPGGGYGRGFDTFQEDCVWKSADCVTDQALPHLARDPRPLFLYLHYLDPHGPYAPPESYRRRFALGHPGKEFVRQGNPNPIADWLYKHGPDPGLTAADLAYLVDLYDDKIAFFDAQLARLVAGLRAAHLLEDSIVVFAADHGEEFLEHGDVKHCHNLFDTTIRTPLLLRLPGGQGRVIATPVSNLDVVPTVLDLLGGGPAAAGASSGAAGGRGNAELSGGRGAAALAAAAGFEGRSLRPAAEGRPLPPAYQWAAQGALRSVSDGKLKLVRDLGSGRIALFDLAADPKETRDVAAGRSRDAHRLAGALAAWLARSEAGPAAEGVRRAAEADKRLRSVGYLDH
jgi:arylsulfatase A-like enzyme